jgi:hypothetical protein
MTTIAQDTDLVGTTADPVDWHQNGWETCAASAFDVVLYTYNEGAEYSVDSGNTFHTINVDQLCAMWGKTQGGDQVVIYIPRINQFAWVILTTDQNLVLVLASPDEVQESGGTSWVTWLIPAADFEGGQRVGWVFDRPTVSVGDNFLYIAVNLGPHGGGVSIAIRLSIWELRERGRVHLPYFVAPDGVFWLKPTQNTGSTGYFAALMNVKVKQDDEHTFIGNMRVFAWPEKSDRITWFNVPISAVPNEGATVRTPHRADWLSNEEPGLGRASLQILGLTFSSRRTVDGGASGNELWAAWWGHRTVNNPPAGIPTLGFPYPHIGIAIVDLSHRRLKAQRHIWSRDFAFVFPDLATNSFGDVGLAFCWGGGEYDPQFGVGMLTGPDAGRLVSITEGPSSGAGGDYISIRMSFPDVERFAAAGFNVVPPEPKNHPHYVIFTGRHA